MFTRNQPGTAVPATGTAQSTSRTVGLIALLALMASRLASAEIASHSQWWADAGIGGGTMSASSGSAADGGGGGGVWIEATLGHHLNDRWLMGVQIGGLGMHPSGSNCSCYGGYGGYAANNSIYGETLTHTLLAVRYEPKTDHGWVWGLATGPAFYSNRVIGSLTGTDNNGNGWSGMATAGYDWKVGQGSTHIEAILNAEHGHVSLNSPFVGGFDYSTIAASVHIALH
jgi:hypothetical protein